MAYLGKSPSQGVRNRYYFTASGGETSISGALTGGTLTFTDGNYVDVNLNGVTLVAGTDYNTSTANTIAGLSALTASDVVEIVVYDVFSVFSGNVNSDFSVGGNLSVTGTTAFTGATTVTGLTTTGDINFGDSDKAVFGADSDMSLFHNGNNAFLDNDTGTLFIQTDALSVKNAAGTESVMLGAADGAVTLYHNNVAKLATTATGVAVTGNATFADNDKAIFGAGSDLQIYHDGSHSRIYDNGGGELKIMSNGTAVRIQKDDGENMILANTDGAVNIYYDGSAKLATTATGVDVTGDTAITGHASIGVDAIASTRALTVAGATDGSGSSILVCYNSSLSPKFSVRDDGFVSVAGSVDITGDTNSNGAELYLQVNNNNTTDNLGAIHFGNNVDSTLSKILSGTSGANNSSYLTFSTSNAGSQSERMRIDSSGNVGISTTTTTRARLNIDTDGTNNSSGYGIALTNTAGGGATFTLQVGDQGVDNGAFTIRETGISGTTRLKITSSNGYLVVPGVYNLTTGSGANVFVSSAGTLQRSTSSRRYKNSIEDATHGLTELLALRPVTYKGNNDGDTVFGGLIAEEVHDAGLTEFVTYNDNDEPDALAYSNMVSLCIKAIQEQQATIIALEARIAALET